MSSTNIESVKAFCAAWSKRDVEHLLSFFDDEIVYLDMPFPDAPQRGKDFMRGRLTYFYSLFSEVKLNIKHIAESAEGVVWTERTDTLTTNGNPVHVPVSSAAVVRNGKIAEWREYYDLETLERRMSDALGKPWRIDLR